MAKRRNLSDQFKARAALEALRGDKTIQEIIAKHRLHPNQVNIWKRQAIREEQTAHPLAGRRFDASPARLSSGE